MCPFIYTFFNVYSYDSKLLWFEGYRNEIFRELTRVEG